MNVLEPNHEYENLSDFEGLRRLTKSRRTALALLRTRTFRKLT